jgi:hypothetical protein
VVALRADLALLSSSLSMALVEGVLTRASLISSPELANESELDEESSWMMALMKISELALERASHLSSSSGLRMVSKSAGNTSNS